MPLATSAFRAMGSECEVLLAGVDPARAEVLLAAAQGWVEELEQRWSRFRPDSTLSRLNASPPDVPVMVDDETFALLLLARDVWDATGGRVDPTVHDAVVAAGYDRSFDRLAVEGPAEPGAVRPAPGFDVVELDPALGAVARHGARLDLGGLGKGRTADIVAGRLLDAGVPGVCVNLGGDVRVAGPGDEGAPWVVGVDGPDDTELATVELLDGAVATSSRHRRQWVAGGVTAHHLIDPRTGRPAAAGVVAVTVVGGDAVWSEAYAKAALVAGPTAGAELVEQAGLAALVVHDDGTVDEVGSIAGFLAPTEGAAR